MDRLRKLDALFSEKVLGLTLIGDAVEHGVKLIEYPGQDYGQMYRMGKQIPPYTRSLDAAWEGLNRIKFGESYLGAEIHQDEDGAWHCWTGPNSDDYYDHTKTVYGGPGSHPAEALVLACLRAVGVAEEELK